MNTVTLTDMTRLKLGLVKGYGGGTEAGFGVKAGITGWEPRMPFMAWASWTSRESQIFKLFFQTSCRLKCHPLHRISLK